MQARPQRRAPRLSAARCVQKKTEQRIEGLGSGGIGLMAGRCRAFLCASLLLILAVGACAPAPTLTEPTGGVETRPDAASPPTRKVLTIATSRELHTFADFVPGGTSGGGNSTIRSMA